MRDEALLRRINTYLKQYMWDEDIRSDVASEVWLLLKSHPKYDLLDMSVREDRSWLFTFCKYRGLALLTGYRHGSWYVRRGNNDARFISIEDLKSAGIQIDEQGRTYGDTDTVNAVWKTRTLTKHY